MMSCSASRRSVNSEVRTAEREGLIERESVQVSAERLVVRDTVYRDVAVVVRDTLREVTTVTVQIGASGDTLMRSVVTDRFRGRGTGWNQGIVESRNYEIFGQAELESRAVETRSDVRVVERENDDTMSGGGMGWMGRLVLVLKWIFWVCVMVVVVRVVGWLIVRFG